MKQHLCRIRLKDNCYHLYPSRRHHIGKADRLPANKRLRLQPRFVLQKEPFAFVKHKLDATNRQSPLGNSIRRIILQYPVMPDIRSQYGNRSDNLNVL